MNHTELPFTEPCFPGTFPSGDEVGLVSSLPSLPLAPELCSHSSRGRGETPPAPFCAAGFSFPSAGFERLFYFWSFMEVLVITCHLLALPERQEAHCAPQLCRRADGVGALGGGGGSTPAAEVQPVCPSCPPGW